MTGKAAERSVPSAPGASTSSQSKLSETSAETIAAAAARSASAPGLPSAAARTPVQAARQGSCGSGDACMTTMPEALASPPASMAGCLSSMFGPRSRSGDVSRTIAAARRAGVCAALRTPSGACGWSTKCACWLTVGKKVSG